jgi:hypothetical protein
MRSQGSRATRERQRENYRQLEIDLAHARLTALGTGLEAAPLRERIDALAERAARRAESDEQVIDGLLTVIEMKVEDCRRLEAASTQLALTTEEMLAEVMS